MRIGTLKESYAADAALFDSRTQKIWLAIGLALLVLFPFMANDYWLYLACLVAINVASATGLNILTGYTGLVSLGQAAFMGLGAYTVAILQTRWGTPALMNILAGGAVFMTMVPELLKFAFDLLPSAGHDMKVFLSPVRTVVFGLLIVGFLVFEPHGLAEVWRRMRRFFHLWPFKN